MIRLYGVEKGNGSWPRVTAGVRYGLRMLGQHAGFYDLGRVDSEYNDDSVDVERGYDAPAAICVGPPPAASIMLGRGEHKQRLLMIATNSSWLSEVMMERAAKMVTGFIGTSAWASSVIERYAHGRPVYTFPHGVHPDFGMFEERVDKDGVFSVLHLASTHMQRKGTAQLIFGWAQAMSCGVIPDEGRLRLVVDGPRGYFLQTIHQACVGVPDVADTITLESRRDLTGHEMALFYARHHAVCQPSRAEGFGLVPLEARACGVPVIATSCTGHADHMRPGDPGVVLVPHGPPMPVDDGPGAFAPAIEASDIAGSLGRAWATLPMLTEEAVSFSSELRHAWGWTSVTADFLSRYGGELGII